MPQFDFLSWPSQIFWLVVTFALMYLFISRIMIPEIRDVYTKRDLKFDEKIKQIDELNDKIDALTKKITVLKDETDEKVVSIRAKAKSEYDKNIEDGLAIAKKKLEDVYSGKIISINEEKKVVSKELMSNVDVYVNDILKKIGA